MKCGMAILALCFTGVSPVAAFEQAALRGQDAHATELKE